MTKSPTHKNLLDGIKDNVELTTRQIYYLQQDLHSPAKDAAIEKRHRILQKLSTLEENLQLLMERWRHALKPESSLEHSLAKSEVPLGRNDHA